MSPNSEVPGGWQNSLIGYTTPVFVRLHDARLAGLSHLLKVAVFVYVLVWNLAYHNQYIEVEAPVGTTRMSFRAPTFNGCSPLKNSCHMNLRNFSELPYCQQNPNASAMTFLPCEYRDSMQAVYEQGDHAILATYVEEIEQKRICQSDFVVGDHVLGKRPDGVLREATVAAIVADGSMMVDWSDGSTVGRTQHAEDLREMDAAEYSCSQLWRTVHNAERSGVVRPGRSFVADVERFTLLLDHSIAAPTLGISESARNLRGYIKTKDPVLCSTHPSRSVRRVHPFGEEIEKSTGPPCYIIPNQTSDRSGLDVFTIETLLEIAGIDLDKHSAVLGNEEHSNRREGVLLAINIVYSNYRPFKGIGEVDYEYQVFAIPATPKYIDVLHSKYPNERLVSSVHGVKIYVIQSGQLGKFSMLKLLVTLTTGLTLLAVSNFVVDNVALYLLPEKASFQRLKYPSANLRSTGRPTCRHPSYNKGEARKLRADGGDGSDEESEGSSGSSGVRA